MKTYIFIAFLAVSGLFGCAKEDDEGQLKQRAKLEEEGQQEKIRERAVQMEKDLASRHDFYGALEGEYEGTVAVQNENYKIRFTFARSIPPYTGDRIRELSEIEADLTNLFFHMQVVQWHAEDNSSAVGCRVTGIRPNIEQGQFVVASSECPNLYAVMISEGGSNSFKDKSNKAKNLSKKIRENKIALVPYVIGSVQPSSISDKYAFSAKRVSERK